MMKYLVIFDTFSLVLSLIGNFFAMQGVLRGKIKLTGYRRFLTSLLVSGSYICAIRSIFLLRQTAFFFTEDFDFSILKCAFQVERSLEMTGYIAFLITLCGMFFDHFLGIVYPHRYRQVMNDPLMKGAAFFIWVAAVLIVLVDHAISVSVIANTSPEESKNSTNFSLPTQFENCSLHLQPVSIEDSMRLLDLGELVASDVDTIGVSQVHDVLNRSHIRAENSSLCKLNLSLDQLIDISLTMMDTMEQNDASNNEELGICSYFDRNFYLSLEMVVLVLIFSDLAFMGICQIAFGKVIRQKTGRVKEKVRKLNITTLMLLGTFSICWIPFVSHEITMALMVKMIQRDDNVFSMAKYFHLHRIFHSLFMCSMLVVPVICMVRIGAVRRYLLQRYGNLFCKCFKRWKQRPSTETSNSSNNNATNKNINSKDQLDGHNLEARNPMLDGIQTVIPPV